MAKSQKSTNTFVSTQKAVVAEEGLPLAATKPFLEAITVATDELKLMYLTVSVLLDTSSDHWTREKAMADLGTIKAQLKRVLELLP